MRGHSLLLRGRWLSLLSRQRCHGAAGLQLLPSRRILLAQVLNRLALLLHSLRVRLHRPLLRRLNAQDGVQGISRTRSNAA